MDHKRNTLFIFLPIFSFLNFTYLTGSALCCIRFSLSFNTYRPYIDIFNHASLYMAEVGILHPQLSLTRLRTLQFTSAIASLFPRHLTLPRALSQATSSKVTHLHRARGEPGDEATSAYTSAARVVSISR